MKDYIEYKQFVEKIKFGDYRMEVIEDLSFIPIYYYQVFVKDNNGNKTIYPVVPPLKVQDYDKNSFIDNRYELNKQEIISLLKEVKNASI